MAFVHAEAEAEAEADPQFAFRPGGLRQAAAPSGFVYHYQTYHNTPASTTPLVASMPEQTEATSEETADQKILINPYQYNGLYNPYYGLNAGYYGNYPYGAGFGNYFHTKIIICCSYFGSI